MFRKVMVVNDDEISLFVSSKMISKTGFANEVVTARHGQHALQIFDQFLLQGAPPHEVPDLVFLDLQMPVMDGWEFLEVFSHRFAFTFPHTRFVINSISVHPDDQKRVMDYPFVAEQLHHPLGFDVLIALMERFRKGELHAMAG